MISSISKKNLEDKDSFQHSLERKEKKRKKEKIYRAVDFVFVRIETLSPIAKDLPSSTNCFDGV